MSKKLSFLVLFCFFKFWFCFSLFLGMMPSHSSCGCAHSRMDLPPALALVQTCRSHCFIQTKQSEEKRGGLMERQTRGSCTACEVSSTCHGTRCSWACLPLCTAVMQLRAAQCNGDRKYLYIDIYIYVIYIKYIEIIIYIYYTLS